MGVTPPASRATAGSGPVPLRFHDGNPARVWLISR